MDRNLRIMFENDDTTIYVSEELGNLPESLAIPTITSVMFLAFLLTTKLSGVLFSPFVLFINLFIQFGRNNHTALNIILMISSVLKVSCISYQYNAH